MIYFTADLHFGHANILKHCNRPFSSVEEMDKTLIANWNAVVKKHDDIYILGDMSMKGNVIINEVMPKLNGRKYLIKGNHDLFINKVDFKPNQFEWIKDYYEMTAQAEDNQKLILMHYPMMSWNHMWHGSIQLHGHIHAKDEYNLENASKGIRRFDVGVDANNYYPVSIKAIMELARLAPLNERLRDEEAGQVDD